MPIELRDGSKGKQGPRRQLLLNTMRSPDRFGFPDSLFRLQTISLSFFRLSASQFTLLRVSHSMVEEVPRTNKHVLQSGLLL